MCEDGTVVSNVYLLLVYVLPVRCPFQIYESGSVMSEYCDYAIPNSNKHTPCDLTLCPAWGNSDEKTYHSALAQRAGMRASTMQSYTIATKVNNDECLFLH